MTSKITSAIQKARESKFAPDETDKGYETLINTMRDNKIGKTYYRNDVEGNRVGIAQSNESPSDIRKYKLVSAVKLLRDKDFGGSIEPHEIEGKKFEEYKEWWNNWKAENGIDGLPPALRPLGAELEEEFDEEEMELEECCENGDCKCKEGSDEEKLNESIKATEKRIAEAMKSDYQKELEEISDFIF